MNGRQFHSVFSRFAIIAGAGLAASGFAPAVRADPAPPTNGGVSGSAAYAEAADLAATELVEHHRHHHHGGVTKFIAMSLDTLSVSAAKQPKLDQLQSDLYQSMIPARDLENGLLLTLADGVASGNIDAAKADAAVGQLDAAATALQGATAVSLNSLHELLSKREREALVDKVRSHWNVWRRVNSEEDAGGREKSSWLSELVVELDLTPDQVGKLAASLHTGLTPLGGLFDSKRVDAHVQEFSSAFLKKSFDANKLLVNSSGLLATYGAKRMALFYEIVTPLLTPAQRTTLSQHLREHAGQPLANSSP